MEAPKQYDKSDRREICAMVRFFVESGRLGEDLQDICDYMNQWGLYHPEFGLPWTELSMEALIDADYEVAEPAPKPRETRHQARQRRQQKTARQSQSESMPGPKRQEKRSPAQIVVPSHLPSIPKVCVPAQTSVVAKSEFHDVMKELFQKGLSMEQIAQQLNEAGLVPEGHQWSRTGVKRELTRDPEVLRVFLQRSSRAFESFSDEARDLVRKCLKASMSVSQVVEALNQQGFRTPQGIEWKRCSLYLHIDREPDLKMLLMTKAHRHYDDDPRLRSRVLELLDKKHSMPQIANILNKEGYVAVTTGTANWSRDMVRNLIKRIRHAHQRAIITSKGA